MKRHLLCFGDLDVFSVLSAVGGLGFLSLEGSGGLSSGTFLGGLTDVDEVLEYS